MFHVFYYIIFDICTHFKIDLTVLVVLGLQWIWKGGTEFPNAPFPYIAIPTTNTAPSQWHIVKAGVLHCYQQLRVDITFPLSAAHPVV